RGCVVHAAGRQRYLYGRVAERRRAKPQWIAYAAAEPPVACIAGDYGAPGSMTDEADAGMESPQCSPCVRQIFGSITAYPRTAAAVTTSATAAVPTADELV